MSLVKNNELETIIKMENLIGNSKDKIFGNKEEIKINDTIITLEDFTDFMNIIENLIQEKQKRNKISNNFNKKNKEIHKITNQIAYYKKIGNIEKMNEYITRRENYYKNRKEGV